MESFIPPEYVDTIPEENKEEFLKLVSTGDPTKINEAFMRFSILGCARYSIAKANLIKSIRAYKEKILGELELLRKGELIPLTRKERFSDTFSILKDDVVRRYKNLKGEK